MTNTAFANMHVPLHTTIIFPFFDVFASRTRYCRGAMERSAISPGRRGQCHRRRTTLTRSLLENNLKFTNYIAIARLRSTSTSILSPRSSTLPKLSKTNFLPS